MNHPGTAIRVLLLLALGLGLPGLSSGAEIQRLSFPNGLTVLLLERHAHPYVAVHVRVRAGSLHDPPGKAGLAHLTAALLTQGTATRSATEIAETIEFVGGSLTSGSGRDHAQAALTVLKRDLELGMALLADVLRRPSFDPEELERKRSQILASLRAQEDEPGTVAAKAFARVLFGSHPYGHPVEGTPETLASITREDVVAFHRRWYRPERTFVGIAGDVTAREVRLLVQRYLGDWEPGREKPPVPPPPPRPKRSVTHRIHRNITQCNIVLGHLGIRRDNPDYYAFYVMNYILGGGGFSSRLMATVRDAKGLAYAVSSGFRAGLAPGEFRVVLQTRNASAREAIQAVLTEIRRIRESPVSPRELEDAKAYLVGSFPLRLDTNRKAAPYLSYIGFYGLGLDYFEAFPRRIRSVTREDVLRVARQYLHPEAHVLVVVGNLEEAGFAGGKATP